jgi:FSR family fosmidomycin resistance protein-like MFS transporter
LSTNSDHRIRTLWLVGVLHAFTHVYQVALLPLYFPIMRGFKLAGVGEATALVTVMMIAYFLPAYGVGVLADRFSRKKMLGWGLLVNALGFVGLSLAPNYPVALACVVLCGLGGSIFHPSATALVASLYPSGTGKALGLIGSGASVGFFAGPIYAGWRAEQTGDWRTPVLELGVLGLVMGGVFAWLAEEHADDRAHLKKEKTPVPMFTTAQLWAFFLAASFFFSLRDFAGMGMGSLGSLFLQNAHGYQVGNTGNALSWIFIASAVSNPLFGHLSDSGRLRWASVALVCSALLIAIFPHVPKSWVIPTYLVYGFFFLANYPMVEAALMEAVPDSVRGRVFGLFITVGGLIGNLSHWVIGQWVERLGPPPHATASYFPLYYTLTGMILVSLLGLVCLRALRRREEKLSPLTHTDAPPLSPSDSP